MILHKMTKAQLIEHVDKLYRALVELEYTADEMLADHKMSDPRFVSRRDAAIKIRDVVNQQVQLDF